MKTLLTAVIALSVIYASTGFAANYTVTIANRTTCSLSYSYGNSSTRTSIPAGKIAGVTVTTGQQLNLYMYTTMAHSYPVCGYQASTASVIYYYDSAKQSYVEKATQGTTISGSRPFSQRVILNGSSYTLNGGETAEKIVKTHSGIINVSIHGGNIK